MNKIDFYLKIVSAYPNLKLKGASMKYTSVNGNMFSFLTNEGELSIRLPEKARQDFIKLHQTNLSIQHGVIMKEYVVVPDKLFKEVRLLKRYFKLSYEYAHTLKAKATKKPKNKK